MNRTVSKGFTLIELIISVAILAIVASIAYPAFTGYGLAAGRPEGKIALNEIAMAQERFFGNNNNYTLDLSLLSGFSANPVITDKALYSVASAAGPTGNILTSFILTATPQGSQSRDVCTEMTLTSTGVKGGTPSKDQCW